MRSLMSQGDKVIHKLSKLTSSRIYNIDYVINSFPNGKQSLAYFWHILPQQKLSIHFKNYY